MSDFISRQDAIEALESNKSDWNNDYNRPIDKDIQALKALPSAEADRPIGEWELDDLIGWKCTNCGKHIVLNINEHGKFCPNCGAKMKNGDSE